MQAADLPEVQRIADTIHIDYPEEPAVFADRLAIHASGCYFFDHIGTAGGYLISHPGLYGAPPALGAVIGKLPQQANSYYIHDLALMPGTRGQGAAREIIERIVSFAKESGYDNVSLTAVGGTAEFWSRFGFVDVSSALPSGKLASYGEGALYMRREL